MQSSNAFEGRPIPNLPRVESESASPIFGGAALGLAGHWVVPRGGGVGSNETPDGKSCPLPRHSSKRGSTTTFTALTLGLVDAGYVRSTYSVQRYSVRTIQYNYCLPGHAIT